MIDKSGSSLPRDGSTKSPAAPEGLWDILPAAAKVRRALEGKLRETFEARGFGEVISPTFEYYDLLSIEAGKLVEDDMIRFMGSDGRLLALRPEMTTSIARLVAQRFRPEDEPHRLYYVANVFREHPSKQGQPREFWQAGIERVGGGAVADDVEVVALFIEAIQASGQSDFVVGLGQIDIVAGSIRALAIGPAERSRLMRALGERNIVAYNRIVEGLKLDSADLSRLKSLPALRGGADTLEQAKDLVVGDEAAESLAELTAVYQGLVREKLARRIIIDLGIARDFNYYTGIVFEAYSPGLGWPLGGGGRYDNLLAEFGYEAPAAGFALGLERLERASISGRGL